MSHASARRGLRRLTKNYQYRRVYREGRLVRGNSLWFYLLPTIDGQVKIGVSISRRIIKKTTVRNKLSRAIKEWFRQHRSNSGEDSYEAVVVLKKDTPPARANLKLIREELSHLLIRAKSLAAKTPP